MNIDAENIAPRAANTPHAQKAPSQRLKQPLRATNSAKQPLGGLRARGAQLAGKPAASAPRKRRALGDITNRGAPAPTPRASKPAPTPRAGGAKRFVIPRDAHGRPESPERLPRPGPPAPPFEPELDLSDVPMPPASLSLDDYPPRAVERLEVLPPPPPPPLSLGGLLPGELDLSDWEGEGGLDDGFRITRGGFCAKDGLIATEDIMGLELA